MCASVSKQRIAMTYDYHDYYYDDEHPPITTSDVNVWAGAGWIGLILEIYFFVGWKIYPFI